MKTSLLAPLTVALLTLTGVAGCAIDTNHGLHEAGNADSGRSGLTADAEGNLLLQGHVLSLPQARESRRFGVTFVDVSTLSSAWRPLSAPAGGIVVAAIRSDSPLAAAGFHLFDRIVAVEGESVASLGSLVARLEAAPVESQLHVTRQRLDLDPRTVAIDVGGELDSGHQVWVPFVFEHSSHPSRSELTVGPFDTIFYTWDKRELVSDGSVERFEWGTLFNLVVYRSETRRDDEGEFAPRRTFRLFYFITL